ncbi:hypothetical protein [Nostoc sp.]
MNNFSVEDDVTVLEIKVFTANGSAIACYPERLRFLSSQRSRSAIAFLKYLLIHLILNKYPAN